MAERACYTFAHLPLIQFLSPEEQAPLRKYLDHYSNSASTSTIFEREKFNFIRRMVESPLEATATAFLSRKPAVPASGNYISLCAMLSHPLSSGNVHIQSSDPSASHLIDFKHLNHPLDAQILGYHLRKLNAIAQTKPLADFIKPGSSTVPPKHAISTVVEAKLLIEEYCGTIYHPCGTCAMIPKEIGGVVDERLMVYGTTNVRIVDASIFPIIPRGNIISTVYAVAEKAADIISEDLKLKRTT